MISKDLLESLCCPETRQGVVVAEEALITKLNQAIASGTLKNRAGKVVTEKIEGGLIREDKSRVYPIRNNIPIMISEEAIPLETSFSVTG